MSVFSRLKIESIHNTELQAQIQNKLDQKAKPVGSLGQMERIALQSGLIQKSLSPTLSKPVMLTIASDHLITEEGVSPAPSEITWQQVLNFLNGGGGIGLFSDIYGLDLFVVDAGTNYDFTPHPKLINKKVRKGTRNFLREHAMTMEECETAINNGREVVRGFAKKGTNIIGFGEMGIGNTTPATALLSIFTGTSVDDCVGPGCGLPPEGVMNKAKVIKDAIQKHGIANSALENLARFGGLEIATIAGGMLEAAANKMMIIVDGFITTSAFMAAYEICPEVRDYAFFSHFSKEPGHQKMLEYLKVESILDLDLRLGEGTGAAVAYSIIKGSVIMLNKMTSFEDGKVSNTSHIKYIDKDKQLTE